MDMSKILDKIKKCMALATSGNEHEAAAAIRQARALMDKHGLTDDDLLAAEAGEAFSKASAMSRPAHWECALASVTADVFGCRVIFRERISCGEWVFIGVGANFEVAKYCFAVLLRQVKKARAEHIKTALRRCKTATKTRRADLFCEGWVRAATGKLDSMTLSERNQQALDAYVDKRYPVLSTVKTHDRNGGKKTLSGNDVADYGAGLRSGRNAELNRGVGAGAAPMALE